MAKKMVFMKDGRQYCFEVHSTYPYQAIQELHKKASVEAQCKRTLEVSTASAEALGRDLSALNLQIPISSSLKASVESLFQGSKVFSNGGPYQDLYRGSGKEAKRDKRLKASGEVIGFKFFDRKIPSCNDKTFFYKWLYINVLLKNPQLDLYQLDQYDSFTDIFFNPDKGLNCQADAIALYMRWRLKDGLIGKDCISLDEMKGLLIADKACIPSLASDLNLFNFEGLTSLFPQ